MSEENKRVLVIDDEKNIRDAYLDILSEKEDIGGLSSLESFLDMDEEEVVKKDFFRVSAASQSKEGVSYVKNSIENNQPFAVAFIDMRMPPGADGLATSKIIRELDPKI